MKSILTYQLRVVCIASTPDGVPLYTRYVTVKNETPESLAAAAREARQWCEQLEAEPCHPSVLKTL